MRRFTFRPRLLECLRSDYRTTDFLRDCAAGVTVGVVALPLAMAFAIASGVSPEAGVWTSIIAGFLIAALGGSRVQIGGPTGAYIVVVYGIVARYGVANLAICTVVAGVLLFVLGFLRLGALIQYVPISVVIGFTNGIAVLILLSQVHDLIGLHISLPDEFFARVRTLLGSITDADVTSVVVGSLCLIALLSWPKRIPTTGAVLEQSTQTPGATLSSATAAAPPRVNSRAGWIAALPGPVIVLIVSSFACAALELRVETIGSRFGGVPQGLPNFVLPAINVSTLRDLIAPIIAIALLGAIESLLSARVADSMIRDRHDPNQELMAQGIANVIAPLAGGIPATGAIARTATNVRTGGRTPIAGIVHALTLLIIVLVAAPWARFIPLPTLAAILVVVAINMADWHAFRDLRRYSIPYGAVLLTTFVLTVAFDLSTAVEVGLILSCLFFIYRISDLTEVEALEQHGDIATFRVFGALFFGSVGKLAPLFDPGLPCNVVLDMAQVISMDNTAVASLEDLHRSLTDRGGRLLLCGLNPHPRAQLLRSPVFSGAAARAIRNSFEEAVMEMQSRERDVDGHHIPANGSTTASR